MPKLKQFLKENWVLVLSLIYIISPIDIIPGDIATGLGLIDDLGVLIFTFIYLLIKSFINKKDKESE